MKKVENYHGVAVTQSKFAKNSSPVYVSDNMTAKMKAIPAISTSNIDNEICRKRALDPKSICHKCYAAATENRYKDLHWHLEDNFKLLTSEIVPKEMLPVFLNVAIVRFEAFGDLMNETQVINYFNICRVNPNVRFALWTKNPAFIDKAIKAGNKKPKNLNIIVSSPFINKVANCEFDFVDKIFTVYDPKFIKENDIQINCGARSCATCRRCYTKNKEFYISEKLK